MVKNLLLLIFCFFSISAGYSQAKISGPKKYKVTGYVGGYRGLVRTEDIDAEKLTHIIYAFVNCKDSMAVLTNLSTDSTNFRKLNLLKQKNPDLKILISVGGWSWSDFFSDAALTPTSRTLFAKTSVDIVRQYQLDGVDIDWEYPGMPGEEGNVVRPEDKQNYTLLLQAIRAELNKLQQETGKKYELTAAVGGSQSFIDHTEMDKVAQILDYVYLMTYDYSGRNKTVSHHTNLFPTKKEGSSAHQSVKNFMAAGVPKEKLGLGAAFYGKGFEAASTENYGLHQPQVKTAKGGGYTEIKDNLIGQQGYKRYWDKKAKAPYLFNDNTKVFITYEDEKSIKAKCRYIRKNNLAGIFFWEYFNDPKEYLINAIHQHLP
ncbi:glycoside hydrolase family 18 protein [Adhaeribacter aquaticus]|uniref:glycoside hydrolase family 18 protein n=1 Tax=Adhaeribacter aquaticus TaxID=299567 RepID=UPI000426E7A4|nr:glycoside hydrolase family 18 protein [Adhaeribacter aquaticus]